MKEINYHNYQKIKFSVNFVSKSSVIRYLYEDNKEAHLNQTKQN